MQATSYEGLDLDYLMRKDDLKEYREDLEIKIFYDQVTPVHEDSYGIRIFTPFNSSYYANLPEHDKKFLYEEIKDVYETAIAIQNVKPIDNNKRLTKSDMTCLLAKYDPKSNLSNLPKEILHHILAKKQNLPFMRFADFKAKYLS